MYQLLDIFLFISHLILIGFNLFGWLFTRTRKLHLAAILLTFFSWLVLGQWYGIGYCPLTDREWQVKERLGERNLPDSFIKYLLDHVSGVDFDPGIINILTGVCFGLAAMLSVILNVRDLRKKFGKSQKIL